MRTSQKILLTVLIVFPTVVSFAQVNTIYYDKNWKQTSKGNASYYRVYEMLPDGKYKVEDHYINGKVQMSGNYTCKDLHSDSCKNGYFIYYSESGFIEDEGLYSADKHTGIWNSYYKGTNNLKSNTKYIDDTASYSIIFYDSITSIKIAGGSMLNNKRSGKWEFYYPETGELNGVENYINGSLTGEASYYNPITHNTTKKGKYQDGEMTGVWGFYSSAGILRTMASYENGLREGTATVYDTLSLSNKKVTEGTFHKDMKIGVWTGYYNNRNKSFFLNYKEDKLDGDAVWYYPNGTVKRKGHYIDGKSTGGECYNEKGEMIPYFPLSLSDNDYIH